MSMRLLFILLALAAPLFAAAPASAADIATLGCVDQKVSPQLRAALTATLDTNLRAGTFDYDETLFAQLSVFAEQCGREHGWSKQAVEAARVNTRASIGIGVVTDYARGQGVDVDKTMTVWRGLPDEVRSHRLDDAGKDLIYGKLKAAGLVRSSSDEPLLGRIIAYANIIEISLREFIAD